MYIMIFNSGYKDIYVSKSNESKRIHISICGDI